LINTQENLHMSNPKVQEFLNKIGEDSSLQTELAQAWDGITPTTVAIASAAAGIGGVGDAVGKDLGNKLRWQSWRLSPTSH
jgi:hypothetical protein